MATQAPTVDEMRAYADERAQYYGIDPAHFRSKIRAESNWNPQAVSRDPRTNQPIAYGVGQFTPDTWDRWGNGADIMDWQANIDASARFTKSLNDQFGDPWMAHAAYNAGPAHISSARQKYGDQWLDHLHEFTGSHADETRTYLQNIQRFMEEDTGMPAGRPASDTRSARMQRFAEAMPELAGATLPGRSMGAGEVFMREAGSALSMGYVPSGVDELSGARHKGAAIAGQFSGALPTMLPIMGAGGLATKATLAAGKGFQAARTAGQVTRTLGFGAHGFAHNAPNMEERVKGGLAGLATGAVFEAAPPVVSNLLPGKTGRVARAQYAHPEMPMSPTAGAKAAIGGAEAAVIGAGTFGVSKVAGSSDEDALISAGIMAVLHGGGKMLRRSRTKEEVAGVGADESPFSPITREDRLLPPPEEMSRPPIGKRMQLGAGNVAREGEPIPMPGDVRGTALPPAQEPFGFLPPAARQMPGEVPAIPVTPEGQAVMAGQKGEFRSPEAAGQKPYLTEMEAAENAPYSVVDRRSPRPAGTVPKLGERRSPTSPEVSGASERAFRGQQTELFTEGAGRELPTQAGVAAARAEGKTLPREAQGGQTAGRKGAENRAFGGSKRQVSLSPDELNAARKAVLTDKVESAMKSIEERRKANQGRLFSGVDPVTSIADLSDFIKIGAAYIEYGAKTFKDWSARMIREMGDEIKPYLRDIWKKSNEVYREADRTARTGESFNMDEIIAKGELGKPENVPTKMSAQERVASRRAAEERVNPRSTQHQKDLDTALERKLGLDQSNPQNKRIRTPEDIRDVRDIDERTALSKLPDALTKRNKARDRYGALRRKSAEGDLFGDAKTQKQLDELKADLDAKQAAVDAIINNAKRRATEQTQVQKEAVERYKKVQESGLEEGNRYTDEQLMQAEILTIGKDSDTGAAVWLRKPVKGQEAKFERLTRKIRNLKKDKDAAKDAEAKRAIDRQIRRIDLAMQKEGVYEPNVMAFPVGPEALSETGRLLVLRGIRRGALTMEVQGEVPRWLKQMGFKVVSEEGGLTKLRYEGGDIRTLHRRMEPFRGLEEIEEGLLKLHEGRAANYLTTQVRWASMARYVMGATMDARGAYRFPGKQQWITEMKRVLGREGMRKYMEERSTQTKKFTVDDWFGEVKEGSKAFIDKMEKHGGVVRLADLIDYAKMGESGGEWYQWSTWAKVMFGKDWRLFTDLLAATSPANDVHINASQAMMAYAAYRQGKPYMHAMPVHYDAVNKILRGGGMEEWAGKKTGPFVRNLLGRTDEATVDTWMAQANRLGKKSEGKGGGWNVTEPEHWFIMESTRMVAEKTGWSFEDAQARIWTGVSRGGELPDTFQQALRDIVTDPQYRNRLMEIKNGIFNKNEGYRVAGVLDDVIRKIEKDAGLAKKPEAQTLMLSGGVIPNPEPIINAVRDAVRFSKPWLKMTASIRNALERSGINEVNFGTRLGQFLTGQLKKGWRAMKSAHDWLRQNSDVYRLASNTLAESRKLGSVDPSTRAFEEVRSHRLAKRVLEKTDLSKLEKTVKENKDGFTVDLQGNPAEGGYAVAPSKATETFIKSSEIGEPALRDFISRHAEVLDQPGARVGGWYDSESGRYVLDVSFAVPSKTEAVRIGLWADQDAIFDLNKFEEIRLKKDGKPIIPEGVDLKMEDVRAEAPTKPWEYAGTFFVQGKWHPTMSFKQINQIHRRMGRWKVKVKDIERLAKEETGKPLDQLSYTEATGLVDILAGKGRMNPEIKSAHNRAVEAGVSHSELNDMVRMVFGKKSHVELGDADARAYRDWVQTKIEQRMMREEPAHLRVKRAQSAADKVKETPKDLGNWYRSTFLESRKSLKDTNQGKIEVTKMERAWRFGQELFHGARNIWSFAEEAARLTRTERRWLTDNFKAFVESGGKYGQGGKALPAGVSRAKVEKLRLAWKEIADTYRTAAEQLQVKGFKAVEGEYFPHWLTPEAREALYYAEGELYNEIVAKGSAKGGWNKTEFREMMDGIRENRFGSFENARLADLPEYVTVNGKRIKVLHTSPWDVIPSFTRKGAHRLGWIREYGQGQQASRYMEAAKRQIEREGGLQLGEKFQKVAEGMQGIRNEKPLRGAGKMLFAAQNIARAAHLSMAATTNLILGPVPTATRYGLINTLKNSVKVLTDADFRRQLRQWGAWSNDTFAEMADVADMVGMVGKGSSKWLKMLGFEHANRFVNQISAGAAIDHFTAAARRGDLKTLNQLVRHGFGFTEAEVAKIAKARSLTESQIKAIADRSKAMTNVTEMNSLDSQPWMDTRLASFMMAYMKPIVKLGDTLSEAIYEAKAHQNYGPIITHLSAGITAGAVNQKIRDWLRKKEREDENFYENMLVVLMHSGITGLPGEAFQRAYYSKKFGNPIVGIPVAEFWTDFFTSVPEVHEAIIKNTPALQAALAQAGVER